MQCYRVIPSDLAGVLLYAFVCRGVSQGKQRFARLRSLFGLLALRGERGAIRREWLGLVPSGSSERVFTARFGELVRRQGFAFVARERLERFGVSSEKV